MLPKKTNINIIPDPVGEKRISNLLAMTDHKTTMLPRGIQIDDLDDGVVDTFETGHLKLIIDGKNVPSFFMLNERWGEFSKTWKLMDEDKNIPTPFITIRRIGKGPGTHSGSKFNIPGRKTFRYIKTARSEGKNVFFDIYKIPQPIFIDLDYDIKFFTKYMEDVNEMDKIMFTAFSERQSYANINGHFVPLLLESVDDTSDLMTSEEEKMLVTSYKIRLQGYIINPDEFEKVTSLKSSNFSFQI